MSLAGVINSHTIGRADRASTTAPRSSAGRWLPRFAAGQARGGLCLTEPPRGLRRAGDPHAGAPGRRGVLHRGTKMFVTNGREGNTFALLAVTDTGAQPRHRGMVVLHRREGGAGPHGGEVDRQARYKGVVTEHLS